MLWRNSGIIALLILCFSPTAKAQPAFYSDPFRPTIAKKQKNLSISLRLNLGSTDFKQFSNIKQLIDAATGFEGGDNDLETLQNIMSTANEISSLNSSMNLFSWPVIFINANSRYFEFRSAFGGMSLNTAELKGLGRKLSGSDLKTDSDGNPYLDLGEPLTLAHAVTNNYVGGDFMAMGKVPIWLFNVLFGVGTTVAYNISYEFNLTLPSQVYAEAPDMEKVSSTDFFWGLHAVLGTEFNDGTYNPRILFEARQIYNSLSEFDNIQFNLGISTTLWKVGDVSIDLIDIKDPTIKLEFSRYFYGNNEVAIGGILRNKFGDENLGYVSLNLGGHFVKFETMCLFSKNSIGGVIGLRLGWEP